MLDNSLLPLLLVRIVIFFQANFLECVYLPALLRHIRRKCRKDSPHCVESSGLSNWCMVAQLLLSRVVISTRTYWSMRRRFTSLVGGFGVRNTQLQHDWKLLSNRIWMGDCVNLQCMIKLFDSQRLWAGLDSYMFPLYYSVQCIFFGEWLI